MEVTVDTSDKSKKDIYICSCDGSSVVRKRYSDFVAFHASLVASGSNRSAVIPPLPGKALFNSDKVMADRRTGKRQTQI